jgi:hypothetical protein
MKFRIQLKDPDGFSDGMDEAIEASLSEADLSEDEKEAVSEARRERAWKALEKWVEYNEYVTIEFDTTLGTATVVPRT